MRSIGTLALITALLTFAPAAQAGGCPKQDHRCKDVTLVPPEDGEKGTF